MLVDVIVPVFNALSQTTRCLESVLKNSTGEYRVLVINDCSDTATSAFLRTFASNPRVTLLENPENLGFLKTANRALRYSMRGGDETRGFSEKGDLAILLNSDTIVAKGWLDRFRECFASDPRIGIATAVSNNAENLSLPIPPGYTVHTFAPYVHEAGKKLGYPDITTAIGFCMGIRRSTLEQVGLFDEIFGRGYGEDSDYHFQVLSHGLRSVLVSTCFVYHESHASFSEAAYSQMSKNRPIFDQRWATIYRNELERHVREQAIPRLQKLVSEALPQSRKHDVLFILPTARLFGGIIVVYEIVNRLAESGLDVGVIVANGAEPIQMDLCFAPYFLPPIEWKSGVPEAKVYVATHFETCAFAFAARERHPSAKVSYLIQGYESWFPDATIEKVVETYRAIPNRLVVSEWLKEMVGRWGFDSQVIPNGVDAKMFSPPDDRWSAKRLAEPPTLLTMLRMDPQGGWRFTFSVLEKIKKLRPDVRVIGVGELCKHPDVRSFVDEGHLSADRKTMRKLYQKADIFFDSSVVQGFGLMGLEAMSAGVAVVTSSTGGVREYATDENAVLVPIGNEEALVSGICSLIDDAGLRERKTRKGREQALSMDWDTVAASYEMFFESLLGGGEATSEHEIYAENSFFVEEFLRTSEQENLLLQAMALLQQELERSYVPVSADSVFLREKRDDLMARLSKFPAGLALLRFYDSSTNAVAKAAQLRISGDRLSPRPSSFIQQIESIVPHYARAKTSSDGKGKVE